MEYLFVVTYGRSGSTVLMNLLNAIDGYCIRGENRGIIQNLAEAADSLAKSHAKIAPYDRGAHTPWYGLADIDPQAWAQTLAQGFEERVLVPPDGTRVTGFKEIRYTTFDQDDEAFDVIIDFLASRFPGSRFIFNTRDAAQVVKSGWWANSKRHSTRELTRMLRQSDERFRRCQEGLGKRGFLIDYAEFNNRPDGFVPLLEWLGEELSLAQIEEITTRKLEHEAYRKKDKPTLKGRFKSLLRG